MSSSTSAQLPSPSLRVRLPVVVILLVAIGMALIVPAADLWRTWHTPVVARITLDPPQPSFGQTAHLVVTLYHDSAALVQTTPLEVGLVMLDMDMGLPQLQVTATGDQYQAALPFTMTGTWKVVLLLHVPAHAPWQQSLLVQVRDGRVVAWRYLPMGGGV